MEVEHLCGLEAEAKYSMWGRSTGPEKDGLHQSQHPAKEQVSRKSRLVLNPPWNL